ncbi:MAG: tRNA(Cytosine32)-2-thiocytidine synthetase [Myxococcales bacterium]|nr:tRNA(Cytosine32)-2-thiocytidine synthetase [Myxococcales bacterium]
MPPLSDVPTNTPPTANVPANVPAGVPANVERRLVRDMGRALHDFHLLQEGDRLLVALSGGKDSYAMCVLLRDLQKRAPIRFDLLAVHIDQGHPGYDGAPLEAWLRAESIPHRVIHEDTYSIVTDKIPEGKTYCSLCSRLRRGILYQAATDLGCNKIALGHHRDDALETLMLNLFFGGKLATMPPRLVSDDGRHVVIRPLIYCAEPTLAAFAKERAFPILPCNLCGSQSEAQRKQMKTLLADLEAKNPTLRQSMLAAMGNVNPSHLLDKKLFPRHDATNARDVPAAAQKDETEEAIIAVSALLRATG